MAEEALLGGSGIVQSGQSEILGRTPQGGFIRSTTLLNGECPSMLAQMVTVVLFATRARPSTLPGNENESLPCFARVSWGNGGAQSAGQLEVDYVNGATFSVPAGFLRVEALLEADVPDSDEAINAGAFVGYYPHVRSRNPQRTRNLGPIAPAASVVSPIPFFADRVELHSSLLGATFTLEQFADAAATILLSAVAVPVAGAPIQVPIVNAARYIRVINLAGAAAIVRALYQLTA